MKKPDLRRYCLESFLHATVFPCCAARSVSWLRIVVKTAFRPEAGAQQTIPWLRVWRAITGDQYIHIPLLIAALRSRWVIAASPPAP